jgi:hypothetical protein
MYNIGSYFIITDSGPTNIFYGPTYNVNAIKQDNTRFISGYLSEGNDTITYTPNNFIINGNNGYITSINYNFTALDTVEYVQILLTNINLASINNNTPSSADLQNGTYTFPPYYSNISMRYWAINDIFNYTINYTI